MNKKILFIFGGIVALGIILALVVTLLRGGGGSSTGVAPVNSIAPLVPVSQPKTFKNDTYGFSFKYPGNWYLYGIALDKGNDTLLYNIGVGSDPYSTNRLLTTEDFVPIQVQVYDADPGTLGAANPVTQIITVNGDRVPEYTYIDDLDYTQKAVVVIKIKNNHFLVVRDNDPLTYKVIFQSVLDSLSY